MTVDQIRAEFPALARRHAGKPVAYFDGPGGTQVPRAVAEAVSDYLLHHNGNTHWAFPTSVETDALVAGARETLATFLNAAPAEIAFGANMTTLTFHLARALGREWQAGDEIIVTELDHHANIAPWRALETERGLQIRVARMIPETGQLDWEHLAGLFTGRTRLLAIGAASNALGTITDVRRAARMAHDHGALTFVDAVHYAPHQLVDVRALDCDFLACSAYKFYGPHVGILYGKGDLLAKLDLPKLEPAPDTVPDRLETGTGNFEGIAGAAAAVRFLGSLADGETLRARLGNAFALLHERAANLFAQLWSGLHEIPGLRLYGPGPGEARTPTLSFTIDGQSPATVAAALVDHGIFASHGDFYASTVAQRYGVGETGFIRVGCACYTSSAEITRLVEAIRVLAGKTA